MIVFLARDIPPFVMYCVNGKPRSSVFIESTDSMIIGEQNEHPCLLNYPNFRYIYIYTRMKKHFLNEQRNRNDAAKKRANTSGVGESNNYYEDIYNIPPYNNTH